MTKRTSDATATAMTIRLVPDTEPATELTYPISPDYVEHWTAERAIAEIIANAIDADPEHFAVAYADGVLEISDTATSGVGAEGMVLGYSDKRGRGDVIGQFGEGLKIASLVLARERSIGDVFVETVGYAFTPTVVDQSAIGGLSIPTKSASAPKVLRWRLWASDRMAGTRVRIVCREDLARKAMARFRHLSEPAYTPPTGSGTVVTDCPGGRVWIGGVLVSERKDLVLSYDLSLASAKALQNRDRTIIDGWALTNAINNVLGECSDPVAIRRIVERAFEGELNQGEKGILRNPRSADQRRILAEIGKERFGSKPVFSASDGSERDFEAALDLKDRGYEQAMVKGLSAWEAPQFLAVLGIKAASSIVRNPKERTAETTTWVRERDLTEAERTVLGDMTRIIKGTWGADALDRVRVYSEHKLVTGQSCDFAGFYEPSSGDVAIHRSELASLRRAMQVGTHESAHRLAHRFPGLVGLSYPDYHDRSRGFENALGTMALIAAQRLDEAGLAIVDETTDARSEEAAAEAHGIKVIPGFTWRTRGGRWARRSAPGLAYGRLYEAALVRWAAEQTPRSRPASFAAANFVSGVAVRGLRDGGTAGLDEQRTIDATKPLGLSPAIAWFVTTGVDLAHDRYELKHRGSRRFPDHRKPAWSRFLAEIEALGPAFAEQATHLRAIAEGTTTLDLSTDAWQVPFRRLVELERSRLGLDDAVVPGGDRAAA